MSKNYSKQPKTTQAEILIDPKRLKTKQNEPKRPKKSHKDPKGDLNWLKMTQKDA